MRMNIQFAKPVYNNGRVCNLGIEKCTYFSLFLSFPLETW